MCIHHFLPYYIYSPGSRAYARPLHLYGQYCPPLLSLCVDSALSETSADSLRRPSRALERPFLFPALRPYLFLLFPLHLSHPPLPLAPRVCVVFWGVIARSHCLAALLGVRFRQLRSRLQSSFVNYIPTSSMTCSGRGAKAHSMCALSTVV